MIDAVDQLLADRDRDQLIFVPNQIIPNVHIIISSIPGVKLENEKNFCLLSIERADKELTICRILQHHHKELPEQVKEDLMDHPASGNPLFLSLLMQRLLIMNRLDFSTAGRRGSGIAGISDLQREIIGNAKGSLEEMSISLFREVGKRINPGLVFKVLEYMALSRYGLRDSDFALLLGEEWSYLDFVHMIHYMEESFLHRADGRYDFVHRSIRQGVLRECQNRKEIHRDIFQALGRLDEKDPVRVSEMIYHCIMADEKGYLAGFAAKHQKDDLLLEGAAKCIHYVCKIDNGRWIRQFLASEDVQSAKISFAILFIYFCADLFSENYVESRTKLDILKQLDSLISSFQGERNAAWQSLLKDNSYKCAHTAKFLGDPSIFEFAEKYFSINKDFYQKGLIDKLQLLMAYNNIIVFYKGRAEQSLLRRGIEIAKEGVDLGLCDLLTAVDRDTPVWYYGSMGEIYHGLQEPENALGAYEHDLETRREWAGKYPSAYSMRMLGGGYYNVGNALMMLGRFEDALPYYEKALELSEYGNDVPYEKVSKLSQLSGKINLYNNYAEALWEVGCEDDREDYILRAFFYKKETVKMDRYYQQITQVEYNFNRDLVKLARIVSSLAKMDISRSKIYLKDFFDFIDSFLTEDESLYKVDHSLKNMWMLKDEYIGVLRAIRELRQPDAIVYIYIQRCYNALVKPIDENIMQEKGNLDVSSYLNIIIDYYNKSALLYDLGEKSFNEEALEASLKAIQELERLENEGIYKELDLIRQKALCAYQAGRCYLRVEDRNRAMECLKEAVEKQTMIAAATSSAKEKETLEEFQKGYRRCKDEIAFKTLFDPFLAAEMKEIFDKKLAEEIKKSSMTTYKGDKKDGRMHGKGTMNYVDGSIYTGEWANGKRSGVGKLTWMSGKGEYYGQWKEDMKDGYGESVFPNGGSYRGEWKEGKIHGYGIKTDARGVECCGIWQAGNLYKKLSKIKVVLVLQKYSKILS